MGQAAVKTYLCPSDPTAPSTGINANYPGGIGACSYACNYLVFGTAYLSQTNTAILNPDGFTREHAATSLPRLPAAHRLDVHRRNFEHDPLC